MLLLHDGATIPKRREDRLNVDEKPCGPSRPKLGTER